MMFLSPEHAAASLDEMAMREQELMLARGRSAPARRAARHDVRAEAPVQTLPTTLPKGQCPKCGRHIGRGVGLHAMRCKG